MNAILIYINMDAYLAQWLIHESGGEPVKFPKNSTEYNILQVGLVKLPKDHLPNLPGDNTVAIALPWFKRKDIRVYNYLPKASRNAIKRCVRNRFQIALWEDLHRFGYIGLRKQDLIWAWMEANGIAATETNFNTVLKIYQRRRGTYLKQKYRENLPDFGPQKKVSVHEFSGNAPTTDSAPN